MDDILETGVVNSLKIDSPREYYLMDIGDPIAYSSVLESELARRGSVFSFGGFIGEIILTFTLLHEFILSNPNCNDFIFAEKDIEDFMVAVIDRDTPPLEIFLKEEPCAINGEELDDTRDRYLKELIDGKHVTGRGMKFLLQHAADL